MHVFSGIFRFFGKGLGLCCLVFVDIRYLGSRFLPYSKIIDYHHLSKLSMLFMLDLLQFVSRPVNWTTLVTDLPRLAHILLKIAEKTWVEGVADILNLLKLIRFIARNKGEGFVENHWKTDAKFLICHKCDNFSQTFGHIYVAEAKKTSRKHWENYFSA